MGASYIHFLRFLQVNGRYPLVCCLLSVIFESIKSTASLDLQSSSGHWDAYPCDIASYWLFEVWRQGERRISRCKHKVFIFVCDCKMLLRVVHSAGSLRLVSSMYMCCATVFMAVVIVGFGPMTCSLFSIYRYAAVCSDRT